MTPATKAAGILLATTLANFSVIGFGLGVYERNVDSFVVGVYALFVALLIRWRLES